MQWAYMYLVGKSEGGGTHGGDHRVWAFSSPARGEREPRFALPGQPFAPERAGAVVLVLVVVGEPRGGSARRPRGGDGLPRPHRRLPGRAGAGEPHVAHRRPRAGGAAGGLLHRPAAGHPPEAAAGEARRGAHADRPAAGGREGAGRDAARAARDGPGAAAARDREGPRRRGAAQRRRGRAGGGARRAGAPGGRGRAGARGADPRAGAGGGRRGGVSTARAGGRQSRRTSSPTRSSWRSARRS